MLVLGCGGSPDLGPEHSESHSNNGGSGLNSNARVSQKNPATCPSTFEYFILNGDMIEVEMPGLCTPYFGDRGDPPEVNHDPGVIAERSIAAEHM